MFTVSPQTLLSLLDDWSEASLRSLLRSKMLWAITEPGVNFDKLVLPRNTGNLPKACLSGITSAQLHLFSKILQRRGILNREDYFHQFKIKFLSLSESSGWFEKNILSSLEVGEIRKEMGVGPAPMVPKMQKIPEVLFFAFTQYQVAEPVPGYRFAIGDEMDSALKFFDPEFFIKCPIQTMYLGHALARDFHIPRDRVYQVPHILLPV
jgi:hypothetical protein